MRMQFLLQDPHQNTRLFSEASRIWSGAFRMNGTTGAFWIPSQDSQYSTAVLLILPQSVDEVLADKPTALASRRSIQNFPEGFSRRPLPAQPHEPYFWTGNLQNADLISYTELQESLVERRIGGSPEIAGVLIEDALDNCDESSTPRVVGRETQRMDDFSAKGYFEHQQVSLESDCKQEDPVGLARRLRSGSLRRWCCWTSNNWSFRLMARPHSPVCLFPHAKAARHVMDARIELGEGAVLHFSEGHYHGLSGGIEVRLRSKIQIGPNAALAQKRLQISIVISNGRISDNLFQKISKC